MNLAAQTLHLLRFDLLRLRWVIAACYAVLALSVMTSLGEVRGSSIPLELLPYVCTAIFAIAAVIAVQGDPPQRPEAFWRGQATRPSTLLLEKSLLIGILFVLLPLVIALMTVASYSLTFAEVVQQTAPAARMLAMWVAVCALVAVSTPEFKSAILLFLCSLIGFAGLMNLAGSVSARLTLALPSLPLLPIFVAIGAVIVVTYLRGMSRRVTVALAALLAGVGLFSLNAKPSRISAAYGQPYFYPATLFSQPESLQVDRVALASPLRMVDVSLTRETPGMRYSLSWGLLTAYFASGDSVTVSLQGSIDSPQANRLVALPNGLQLRDGPPRDVHPRGMLGLGRETSEYVRLSAPSAQGERTTADTTDAMPAILRRLRTDSVTKVRVDLMLTRYRQVELTSLPLNGATEQNERGRRLSFRRRTGAGPDAFTATWLTLGPTRPDLVIGLRNDDWRYTRPFLFVLQHAARGDAVVMQQGNVQSRAEAVVLPGIERRSQRFELDGVEGADDRTLDAEWLKGATLRVIRWQEEGRLALSAQQVVLRR